jgi:hypothetical protein
MPSVIILAELGSVNTVKKGVVEMKTKRERSMKSRVRSAESLTVIYGDLAEKGGK